MLESYLRKKLKEKDILLMTHIVIGYPDFDQSMRIVEEMVAAGVDLMELQIPFSEPIADGPVILHANQEALAGGATVEKCFDFAEKAAQNFDIPFLFMTYYNILLKYGIQDFAAAMAQKNLKGAIVPDLPPEEAKEYLEAMEKNNLAPIFIFAPTTSEKRMQYINSFARGFIYCVARKGVTGKETEFSDTLAQYLARCRKATDLPLAVGFGVKEKADIDYLRGKTDIAVIGSQTIRLVDEQGVGAVRGFIKNLR
jgi:tryptophan synthase alpha chain